MENQSSFFSLPFDIQVKISAYLSLTDSCSLAETCVEGARLVRDQQMWKEKLRIRAKVKNLSLLTPSQLHNFSASMIVKDHLLVDNKKLYFILNPDTDIGLMENDNSNTGLAKFHLQPPKYMLDFRELIEYIKSRFYGTQGTVDRRNSVFNVGEGAPSFMIFGSPETPSSKKIVLSMISASKYSLFESVGLVKGQPGGVGGGVTVNYLDKVVNILPIRRIRPRLMVSNSDELAFNPGVVEVAKRMDGLVYYMDASCQCSTITKKTCRFTVGYVNQEYNLHENGGHYLDLLELELILRDIPLNSSTPLLILLATKDSLEDCLCNEKYHSPSLLIPFMSKYDIPWAACNVNVNDMSGIRKGFNWLLKRTVMIQQSK